MSSSSMLKFSETAIEKYLNEFYSNKNMYISVEGMRLAFVARNKEGKLRVWNATFILPDFIDLNEDYKKKLREECIDPMLEVIKSKLE